MSIQCTYSVLISFPKGQGQNGNNGTRRVSVRNGIQSCSFAQVGHRHDVLYADPGSLDRERLVRAARSASLDPAAFEACLDSGRHAATVAADSGLAAGLGVVAVPAVFVNGLYAGAEIDAPYLVWLIEQELARLDVASPRQAPSEAPSAAGYRLRALFPSTHAGQGLALLAGPDGTDDPRMVREGLALSHGIVVRRITTEAVELVHDGRL
jgi:hypothetical protein